MIVCTFNYLFYFYLKCKQKCTTDGLLVIMTKKIFIDMFYHYIAHRIKRIEKYNINLSVRWVYFYNIAASSTQFYTNSHLPKILLQKGGEGIQSKIFGDWIEGVGFNWIPMVNDVSVESIYTLTSLSYGILYDKYYNGRGLKQRYVNKY